MRTARSFPPAALAAMALASCTDDLRTVEDFAAEPPPPAEAWPTPERNVYFGDLHTHTTHSLDAYLLGTLVSPDIAYRHAKGEAVENAFGFEMRLREPLDFLAVTDHGVYLGVVAEWADPTSRTGRLPLAAPFHNVNRQEMRNPFSAQERGALFRQEMGRLIRAEGGWRERLAAWRQAHPAMRSPYFDANAHRAAWLDVIDAAQRHYEPGRFTTFIAYEWTSSTAPPESAAYHRNVVFAGAVAPRRPFSFIDSRHPEDLWAWMDGLREQGADSLAIPHNSNQSNGQVFKLRYSDGRPIDAAFAELRMRNEMLVEVTQIKGTSETHPRLSPADEWADFEILNTRKGNLSASSKPHGSYVREALVNGLALEREGRGNPFKVGMIGATDNHNGAPSLNERSHYGSTPVTGTAENRGSVPISEERLAHLAALPEGLRRRAGTVSEAQGAYFGMRGALFSASGLAAAWAESNTREALFAALRRKETYATSGPRIRLRFFGGFGLDALNLDGPALAAEAYAAGVSMGGDLRANGDAPPQFLVWAQRDKHSAPLQRLQVIKGWYDAGHRRETRERVYDVACSDGLAVHPDTHRCPDNGAAVNLSDCSIAEDVGAQELRTVWTDPHFEPGVNAVYYVRVLENPTCRWSTWDAIRAGVEPREGLPATIQERAWSSPIWYDAGA